MTDAPNAWGSAWASSAWAPGAWGGTSPPPPPPPPKPVPNNVRPVAGRPLVNPLIERPAEDTGTGARPLWSILSKPR